MVGIIALRKLQARGYKILNAHLGEMWLSNFNICALSKIMAEIDIGGRIFLSFYFESFIFLFVFGTTLFRYRYIWR